MGGDILSEQPKRLVAKLIQYFEFKRNNLDALSTTAEQGVSIVFFPKHTNYPIRVLRI